MECVSYPKSSPDSKFEMAKGGGGGHFKTMLDPGSRTPPFIVTTLTLTLSDVRTVSHSCNFSFFFLIILLSPPSPHYHNNHIIIIIIIISYVMAMYYLTQSQL